MKKINFTELQDLVANVDYIKRESYPVVFTVSNNDEEIKYKVSIGEWEEIIDDELNEIVDIYEEPQFLSTLYEDNIIQTVIDIQDPDDMIYDEIGNMLKKKCNLNETSQIYLHENLSFNGIKDFIYEDEIATDVIEELKINV